MAREQGTFTQSANYELQKEGTIDARQFVDVFADLLAFTAGNYIADGFPVTVRQDSTIGSITYKKGWYQYTGGALDDANNWEFMGGGAFDPKDYDLDEFNNVSADPYIRHSGLGDKVLEEIGVFEEDDIASLVSETYTTGSEVKVLDASGDTSLTFPTGASKIAFYKKLNSSNGDLTDWQLLSAPYATRQSLQAVRDVNFSITPELYAHDVFIDDGITTFNPNTQAYQDNFEVLLINTSGERRSVSFIAKTGVTYMVNGVSETSITFQIETGGAIGIFRKLGTDIYIVRGQIV